MGDKMATLSSFHGPNGPQVEDKSDGRIWSCPEAARICEVSHRNAAYWGKMGLIVPIVPPNGTGSDTIYCFSDLILLFIVGVLAKHGVNVETRRRVLALIGDSKHLECRTEFPPIWIPLACGLMLEINIYRVAKELRRRLKESR